MIEVVISQVANGYVVKKTIDSRPSLQNQFVEGPYSYTFVTTEMDAAIKIANALLAGKDIASKDLK